MRALPWRSVGHSTLTRATNNTNSVFAHMPWLPASVRFLRVARQWVQLLVHHEAGQVFLREDRRGSVFMDIITEL